MKVGLMIRIAVTGKGGSGKSTIAAGLARTFAGKGKRVIALDMDPSPNLYLSLGCDRIRHSPLLEQNNLIQERTGADPDRSGPVFRLNPKVDDILEKFGVKCHDGVILLVMGTIRKGGEGCFCPAHRLAQRIIGYLSRHADILIMDMEAGVEHLGRGTPREVEMLLIIVEPSVKSIETATRIARLARDLQVRHIAVVMNKIRYPGDRMFEEKLKEAGLSVISVLPYDDSIVEADRKGIPVLEYGGGDFREKMADLCNTIEQASGGEGGG
jgi:CO dehydrogenase maturation factor